MSPNNDEDFRSAARFRTGCALAIALPCLLTAAAAAAQSASVAAIPVSLPATAPATAPSGAVSDIQARLDSPGGAIVAGVKLHPGLLRQFYAAHNYQPVWPERQAQAAALLGAVKRAGEHGLDPELFHAGLLRDPSTLPPIDRDLLLSDAFLSFADALARGAMPQETRLDDEDLAPEPVSIPAALDSAINSPDPASAIEALAPQNPDYLALRRALQAYAGAASEPVADAHHRSAAQRGGSDERVRQIIVNLERERWLPRHLPADRVWVNLPNAQLVLYRDNQPVFTTRVVIGQNDWQTPELKTDITGILFNPPWNVPPSIAQAEILPKLARNPGYMAQHHMVFRHNGAIQQLPGHGTALGYLKFEMPNRFDVYLHDTPMKALFARDNRRESHGCVRVQNPRELAALLSQQPVEAIDKAIALGTTNRRGLPTPVPVFFVYQTAFLGANGQIEFRSDPYGRDQEIWQHLHPMLQAPVAEREATGQRRG